jgi:hypothetical protein
MQPSVATEPCFFFIDYGIVDLASMISVLTLVQLKFHLACCHRHGMPRIGRRASLNNIIWPWHVVSEFMCARFEALLDEGSSYILNSSAFWFMYNAGCTCKLLKAVRYFRSSGSILDRKLTNSRSLRSTMHTTNDLIASFVFR